MGYYLLHKKGVIVAGLLLIVALLAMVVFFVASNKDSSIEEKEVSIFSAEGREVKRVFIKDYGEAEDAIDLASKKLIESKLYTYASKAKPDLYTGVIREKSYTTTQSNKVTILEFLVDVKPIDLTYKATVTLLGGNISISVACAPQSQQLSTAATCEDPEYI